MFPIALQAISGLQAGVALLTQLLEATVLLMLLDKLATAIRLTYQAGRLVGRGWYGYGVPAILWLADGISLLWSRIDWLAVRTTLIRSSAAVVAAFLVVRHRWCQWHDVTPIARPKVTIKPAVNPLFEVQFELEQAFSVKTLQATYGVRKARTKYQQIGSLISR